MRRLTAPTGRSVEMGPEEYHAWVNRDLAPHLHREAYLHVLRESGVADHHAESLYQRVITPASWTPYPDTARGVGGDCRPKACAPRWCPTSPSICGPHSRRSVSQRISTNSCCRSRWAPSNRTRGSSRSRWSASASTASEAVMVGDSEEADGGARDAGLRVRPGRSAADRGAARMACCERCASAASTALEPVVRVARASLGFMAERIKPPWWLKPMNKVFMAVMRLGLDGRERSAWC